MYLKAMYKKFILLFFVVILAFFLRFYKVTISPPSLNWDEVSIGYNAYSILKTGKDEWGRFLPLNFESYGEYKLPVQIYASIPGISVLGLTPIGVRITPVIYGTLTVLLLYFLAYELFKSRFIALVSALLLAVSPWHIQLTRASFESSFSVFWVVLGFWLLIKGFNSKKWYWVLSSIPLAVSVYTYNSARVFVPLFLVIAVVIYRKEILKHLNIFILAALLFGIFMLPLGKMVLTGEAEARYKLVSVADDLGLVPRINEQRGRSQLPYPIKRVLYNRYSYVALYTAENYLAHFTPSFLFINGAPHRQHSVQGFGELFKIQAPFIIIGLYLLIKRKEKYGWFLIAWLILTFIPVAVTKDSIPNALRTVIAAPVYQILTAYGFYHLLKNISKKYRYILVVIGSGLLFLEFGLFYHRLIFDYPVQYSRDWQFGNKEVVDYVRSQYNNYDLIVFSRYYGEPHMFTLFYLNYPPEKYQTNPNLVRYKSSDWVWVLRFDKFYFPNLSDQDTKYDIVLDQYKDKKVLFIGRKEDFPADVESKLNVNFLDGTSAFEVVSHI
jgi:4-amino-4-deoxy-L-arabinose transferase-like glycosyltransferase